MCLFYQYFSSIYYGLDTWLGVRTQRRIKDTTSLPNKMEYIRKLYKVIVKCCQPIILQLRREKVKGKVLSLNREVSHLILERLRGSSMWNFQVEMSRSRWKCVSTIQQRFKELKMVRDQMRLWMWGYFGDYKASCKCEFYVFRQVIQMWIITYVQLALN